MMELFRKHKKAIYWVIILFVGVPFIFIGTDYLPFMGRARQAMLPAEYGPVATVGDQPIMGDELKQALDRQNQSQPGQPAPDYNQLLQSGQVNDVLGNLVKGRLVDREAADVKLNFDRKFLEEALKKDPSFQNEQGQFDPEIWNSWVREQREAGADWNAIYESVKAGIERRIMAQRVMSSVRVRDEELRQQFERDNSKFTLKYLAIEPKIVPTEEQIKAHYEANKSTYDTPAQRKADFIAISTALPKPPEVDQYLAEARAGKDLDAIAKEAPANLNARASKGGTWISEDKATPEMLPLFDRKAGEVADPIKTPAGYVIVRIEEARVNPETVKREIRASMLSIAPAVTDEERAAQDEKLRALAEPAQKSGDLAAAAAQAGVPVQSTDLLSVKSTEIQNVPKEDVMTFAQGLDKVEQGKVSDVIRGRENAYIAKVTEVVPAVPQPLDAVRERVVADTIAELKQSPEYQQKLHQLAIEIPQKAKTLEEAKTLYPDSVGEVKEVGPFSAKSYDFGQGPFWNAQQVVETASAAGEGKIAGPVNDFMGGQYLIQLVGKVAPDEKAWKEDYPKEKDRLRKTLLARRESERFDDYLEYLLLKADVPVVTHEAAILRSLGLDEASQKARAEEKKAAEAETGEAAPATTPPVDMAPPPAPVEAPAPASAPAAP